jgi:bla regulator protein BlaR1
MNAGGFYDPDWNSNGAIPHGTVISKGKVVSDYKDAGMAGGFIGFNDEDKLILGNMSKEKAVSMGLRDAIEFGPFLIVNGTPLEIVGDPWGRSPRVAIAQRKDGIVLFLVTNTKYFYSGPTFTEMIEVLQKYGAYNAANLDGGSSATLVIENKLINTPRDVKKGVINPRGTVSGFAFK